MGIKITEYDSIYDSIELIYTVGKENIPRIIVISALKELITKIEKSRNDLDMLQIDENMIKEIIDNGGMPWIESEIRKLQQRDM